VSGVDDRDRAAGDRTQIDPDATVVAPRPVPAEAPAAGATQSGEPDVAATVAFDGGSEPGSTAIHTTPPRGDVEAGMTTVYRAPTPAEADAGATAVFGAPPGRVDPEETVAFGDAGSTVALGEPGATVAFGDPAATVAYGAPARPPTGPSGTRIIAPPPNPTLAAKAGQASTAAPAWPVIRKRPRRRGRWIGTLMLLAAAGGVAAFLLLHRGSQSTGPTLAVTAVTAGAPATATCDQRVDVSGAITTNGGEGTISYQWTRSDGQPSPAQQLHATANQTRYPVSLLWTISGRGRITAGATLTVTSPSGAAPATAQFLYAC